MQISGSNGWLLGLCIVALLACKGGPTRFGKNFVSACGQTCEKSGGDESCNDWCQCIYDQAVEEQGSPKKADAWLIDNAKTGTWSPELARLAGESVIRCAPGLYEKKTLRTCKKQCGADAECRSNCDCMLRELMKAKPTRDESILFLIVNADLAQNPAGEAAVQKAVNACSTKAR